MQRLIIIGAGGHGRSVAEAALASGNYELAGFLDDAFPILNEVWGVPVLGATTDALVCRTFAEAAIVAIGNNNLREMLCNQLISVEFELATVVHPRASVSPRALIGAGSTIMAGAIIGTEAELGVGVIVNCGAVVDHHCQVKQFGHLGVNATMAGGSELGHGAWMQPGATLGYGVKVKAGVVLAPGEALI